MKCSLVSRERSCRFMDVADSAFTIYPGSIEMPILLGLYSIIVLRLKVVPEDKPPSSNSGW